MFSPPESPNIKNAVSSCSGNVAQFRQLAFWGWIRSVLPESKTHNMFGLCRECREIPLKDEVKPNVGSSAVFLKLLWLLGGWFRQVWAQVPLSNSHHPIHTIKILRRWNSSSAFLLHLTCWASFEQAGTRSKSTCVQRFDVLVHQNNAIICLNVSLPCMVWYGLGSCRYVSGSEHVV